MGSDSGSGLASEKLRNAPIRVPRPRAHWTPQYIWDRFRVALRERYHGDAPWLTADMTAFLEQWLGATDVVAEFGSGRSTVWFAGRVARVISVEDHPEWYESVQQRLERSGLKNVDYYLGHCDPPDGYVGPAAKALGDEKADVVLVDGKVRDHCALWALKAVRPGGLIVIDNVNRYLPHETRSPASIGATGSPPTEEWARFAEATANWRRFWTSNGVFDTVAFFAPMAN